MTVKKILSLLILGGTLMLLCGSGGKKTSSVKKEDFGKADGQSVALYTLTNRNGVEAKIATYGGIVVSLKVPDRSGKLDDIVLGFDNLDDYVKGNNAYFGALIGRYGNRIAKGRFTLSGVEYKLAVNNGENHLHGGIKGFDKVVWNARPVTSGRPVCCCRIALETL